MLPCQRLVKPIVMGDFQYKVSPVPVPPRKAAGSSSSVFPSRNSRAMNTDHPDDTCLTFSEQGWIRGWLIDHVL